MSSDSPTPTSKRFDVGKTRLPPCCLQVHDDNVVFIGTYQLEKESGLRHGSLDLYHLGDNGKLSALISTTPTSGAILDIKISGHDSSLVATAHSTGNIMVWKYRSESEGDQRRHSIEEVANYELFDSETLVTSIFFSPVTPNLVLATLTTGESATVNIETGTILDYLQTQHSLECWTGSFGEVGELSNVVYTGGDDAKVIAHDLRSSEMVWSTNSRHHGAGVVSILSPNEKWNHSNAHHIWTGSYDDTLRILDLRVTDRANPSLIAGYFPKALKEENLGGGVWRLIPSKTGNDDRVLVCCMYDGARIVKPIAGEGGEEDFEVTRYFKGDHESMCYGGDWAKDASSVVTCSFYDNVVQAWSPELTEK